MIALLKYLRGYVRIKVWGTSPERFMNLCSNKDILLWDITKDRDAYYMCIHLESFYRLRGIVRKTGTKVAILKRYGLPFLLPELFRRKIFMFGLSFSILFWIISSFFVWDIELEGNYSITDDLFYSFLDEQYVVIGMKKNSLDIENLEKEIRKAFTQITWTSAKLDGTKLIISVKENDAPILEEEISATTGKDLVAEYNGTIVSMIVRKGVPQVAIGDVVEKGAILVEGKIPILNDDGTVREYQYVQSDADIIMEYQQVIQLKQEVDYIKKEYTGRTKKKYFLRVGEKEWKIPEEQPYLLYDSVIKLSRPLIFQKLSVPIYFGSYTHREYQKIEGKYTDKEMQILLEEKQNAILATLHEKGVQIIQKNVKIDTNSDMWILTGDYLMQGPTSLAMDTVVEVIPEVANSDTGVED